MAQKLIFLVFAILIICCYILIGISLAERNWLLGIAALLFSVLIMGFGFSLKRKWPHQ